MVDKGLDKCCSQSLYDTGCYVLMESHHRRKLFLSGKQTRDATDTLAEIVTS